jgi:hypothetical protein
MSMFIELADSRFRNVTVAVKLLIGVTDVSYMRAAQKVMPHIFFYL